MFLGSILNEKAAPTRSPSLDAEQGLLAGQHLPTSTFSEIIEADVCFRVLAEPKLILVLSPCITSDTSKAASEKLR